MVNANAMNLTDAAIDACISSEALEASLNWYVAYTKAFQEHTAQANLLRQGYHVYLPLIKTLKKASTKKQQLHFEPMFPRYIFFQPQGREHSIAPVRSSIGVSKLIGFGGEPARLSAKTMNQIREAEILQHNSSYEVLSGLKPGKKVIVNEGPFIGLNGLVSEISEERVMVLMHLLGREAKISFKLAELMLA